jgi:hypothetical protein
VKASLLAAVGVLFALAAPAAAYPQFQLSSGSARCSQCHISPTGGGLLTQWGTAESGDTLTPGGDGRFLHGLVTLPEWLQLGGDFRVAALANDVGSTDGTEFAAFPMQADVGAAIKSGALRLVGYLGARGRVRSGAPTSTDSSGSMVESPSLASYFISREHYVMYQPDEAAGIYVRAGRFAAPYGLRLADHTAYVRRYLGYNLLEETYGIGVGYLADAVEIHATGFVYDPLQGGPRKEVGGAVLVEMQPGDAVIGFSARASKASTDTRLQAGAHAKLWIENAKLLVQGEIDGVHQSFDAGGARNQLAAYVGPVLIPTKGLYTGVAYQAFAEDLAVHSVLHQGIDAWASYLPRAHFEIMLNARGQRIGPQEHAYLAMLQLHYYL